MPDIIRQTTKPFQTTFKTLQAISSPLPATAWPNSENKWRTCPSTRKSRVFYWQRRNTTAWRKYWWLRPRCQFKTRANGRWKRAMPPPRRTSVLPTSSPISLPIWTFGTASSASATKACPTSSWCSGAANIFCRTCGCASGASCTTSLPKPRLKWVWPPRKPLSGELVL